jgi:hypothetical protein
MLNALVKFLVGSSLRVFCFLILYRNHTPVGVAKQVVAPADHQRNIPHRSPAIYMSHRRSFELGIDGIEDRIRPHADVLGVSAKRS